MLSFSNGTAPRSQVSQESFPNMPAYVLPIKKQTRLAFAGGCTTPLLPQRANRSKTPRVGTILLSTRIRERRIGQLGITISTYNLTGLSLSMTNRLTTQNFGPTRTTSLPQSPMRVLAQFQERGNRRATRSGNGREADNSMSDSKNCEGSGVAAGQQQSM